MRLLPSFLFLLAATVSSWAVTNEQPRGFQLHPQLSEGDDAHRYPWILDMGAARIAPEASAERLARKLVLEPDSTTAQLTFRNLQRSDTWIFASVSMAVARKRVIHFRAFDVAILDENKKEMKPVDGGPKLGPLIIYSGGGPNPSYCRMTINAEYTAIEDLRFIKWEIYQADFKGINKTLLAEGHLNDSLALTAPIRKGSEDPPVHLSARAYLDVAKLKKSRCPNNRQTWHLYTSLFL